MRVHYRGGRIFTAAEPCWAESLVVENGRLTYVGDTATAPKVDHIVELDGAFVAPGFVDAHTHLLNLGQSLRQHDLLGADLATIQDRIRGDESSRIIGRGWLYDALDGDAPTRHLLDAVEPDRPVYLISNDQHTAWVNSAALCELGIGASTPDPIGGHIERDPAGDATGMLYENASLRLVRSFLASTVTDAGRDAALQTAFDAYLEAGVTTAVDMALGAEELGALERAVDAGDGTLPLRVAGYWLIDPADDAAAKVHEAVELNRRLDTAWLRVAGVKLMLDGVIDSRTAAMLEPYADGSNADPIWELAALTEVVTEADAAGLAIAMHAIGDAASDLGLDALEHAAAVNGPRARRHRIEHLETVTESNVARLARLGVIASVQPVHADPAIQADWRAALGDERVQRAYPWTELAQAAATLVLGTDAPTAPHAPLRNLYVATTRRSALTPQRDDANLAQHALPLHQALVHATRDAAYACGWERLTGQLTTGRAADFVVLDRDPFAADPEALLTTSVGCTVVAGEVRANLDGGQ